MQKDQNIKTIPPVFYVVLAVLLWSTGGLFIKITPPDAFVAVNLGRALFAAITVGIFIAFQKGFKFDWFTLFSSLFYAGTLSFFVFANKNTTAANAIFLQYTAPIYILVFAPFILKEKFRFSDLLTVVICLIGMSFFFLEPQSAENKLATNVFAGNIAGLISGICLGLYFILLRHPRSMKLNPALSVFYGNVIIVLVMLPFIFNNPQTLTSNDLLAISYLGIFQIGIAYIFFTYGVVKGVRSLDASIIGFIEPLLNPVWVLLFVGERPSLWAVLGGIIIITAVIIHTIFLKKKAEN